MNHQVHHITGERPLTVAEQLALKAPKAPIEPARAADRKPAPPLLTVVEQAALKAQA